MLGNFLQRLSATTEMDSAYIAQTYDYMAHTSAILTPWLAGMSPMRICFLLGRCN